MVFLIYLLLLTTEREAALVVNPANNPPTVLLLSLYSLPANIPIHQHSTMDSTPVMDVMSNTTTAGDGEGICWDCVYETTQVKIMNTLIGYLSPVLIAFGTIGNILSLIVLQTKEFRNSPTAAALSALAVSDLGALLVGAMDAFLTYALGIYIRNIHNAVCKIHVLLTYLFWTWSSYVLAITTIERLLSVWFPLRVKEWVTKKRMIVALIVMFVIMLGIYSPVLVIIRLETPTSCNWSDYGGKVMIIIDAVTNGLIPLVIIFIGNVLILAKLNSAAKRRVKEMNTKDDGSLRSTTLMLVLVAVCFLLLVAPMKIHYFVWNYVPEYTDEQAANNLLLH